MAFNLKRLMGAFKRKKVEAAPIPKDETVGEMMARFGRERGEPKVERVEKSVVVPYADKGMTKEERDERRRRKLFAAMGGK